MYFHQEKAHTKRGTASGIAVVALLLDERQDKHLKAFLITCKEMISCRDSDQQVSILMSETKFFLLKHD